jgi:hypothetical protein
MKGIILARWSAKLEFGLDLVRRFDGLKRGVEDCKTQGVISFYLPFFSPTVSGVASRELASRLERSLTTWRGGGRFALKVIEVWDTLRKTLRFYSYSSTPSSIISGTVASQAINLSLNYLTCLACNSGFFLNTPVIYSEP